MTLAGDNGLLNRTTAAKKKTEEAGIMEQIRLAYQNALIGEYTKKYDNTEKTIAEQIEEDLEAIYGKDNGVQVGYENGVYTVTIPEGTYTRDENGNVSRKAGITIKQGGIAVQSVTVQIVNGVAQAETIVAEVEGLEEEIEWKIEGTEASKFQKNAVESTEGNKRISTATITTGNDTAATSEDVTITVSCGGESASCSAKIIRVVKVTSIESITTNATNGKIDVGSNNITVTATVNEGATEELNWSVNGEYQDYVTITKSNPVINTANNTQTVMIELGSGAEEGTLRITAQNETADVTGTNYVELTVNIPVSGIKMKKTVGSTSTYITNSTNPPAQMPEITIAPTTGEVGLTAEIEPSTASNQAINWTITTNSGVASFNGVAGNTTTGSNVTVQAGSTEGEVTVTATSVGDTSKTVSVKINVAKEVGYFKQEGTKAYYYPSQSATAEERIEITNNPTDVGYIGKYLGMKVKYTPKTKFEDRGTSDTYRLFYIDLDAGTSNSGKYGDGQGTIYLKADQDSGKEATLSSISTTGQSNVTVMAAYNPKWNAVYSGSANENATYSKRLLDKGIWKGYTDTGNLSTAVIAEYAVGAPSLEMWIDSYNAFLRANPASGKKEYNCTVTQDKTTKLTGSTYKGPRADNNSYGYYVGTKEGNVEAYYNGSDSDGYYTASNSLAKASDYSDNSVKDRLKAWNPETSYYWLASPCVGYFRHVKMVNCYSSRVDRINGYDSYCAFCPLVSIKSGVSIEEK